MGGFDNFYWKTPPIYEGLSGNSTLILHFSVMVLAV